MDGSENSLRGSPPGQNELEGLLRSEARQGHTWGHTWQGGQAAASSPAVGGGRFAEGVRSQCPRRPPPGFRPLRGVSSLAELGFASAVTPASALGRSRTLGTSGLKHSKSGCSFECPRRDSNMQVYFDL